MSNEVSTNVLGKEVTKNILPKLFDDINFESLNSSISKLAGSSSKLSDEQRKEAISVVNEWNSCVVKRLDMHEDEVREFLNFIDIRTKSRHEGYHGIDIVARYGEEKLSALAASTNTEELFHAYMDTRDIYDELKDQIPVEEPEDPDLTAAEMAIANADYNKAVTEHNIKLRRAITAEIKAERAWKTELNKNEGIRESVAQGKRYKANIRRLVEDCRVKAQAAKLNISIGDSDTREALMALLDFSKNI